MPSLEDTPDGTEVEEICPCGCLFRAAFLEIVYKKQGIYNVCYFQCWYSQSLLILYPGDSRAVWRWLRLPY